MTRRRRTRQEIGPFGTRCRHVSISTTVEEWRIFHSKARAAGVSASELMRSLLPPEVFQRDPKPADSAGR